MEVIYVTPLPELRGRDEAESARLPRPAERRRERLLRAARGISRELTLRSKVLLEPNMSHKLNTKFLPFTEMPHTRVSQVDGVVRMDRLLRVVRGR